MDYELTHINAHLNELSITEFKSTLLKQLCKAGKNKLCLFGSS